jgi:hypothetical protein
MGTSSNVSSPKTPSWQSFTAVLGDPDWPVQRQSEELWQAAIGDRNGKLRDEIGDPLLAEVCRLADAGTNVRDTIRAFDALLNNNYTAGLTFDMAKRALVRAVSTQSGSRGFASELFVEAVSYYVSRDLPSYVGAPNRISTTGEAIRLKEDFRKIAREAASLVSVKTDPVGWKSYVSQVLITLQGLGGQP